MVVGRPGRVCVGATTSKSSSFSRSRDVRKRKKKKKKTKATVMMTDDGSWIMAWVGPNEDPKGKWKRVCG
jgi:hypothetical protein